MRSSRKPSYEFGPFRLDAAEYVLLRDDRVIPLSPGTCVREVKKGFHTARKIAGIEGFIWKDLRATFGTRLAEAGCDAFTIAGLLGHSDIRVTMRYVRAVESSKRVAVEAVRLNSGKVGQVLVSWPKQPATALAVSR